MNMQHKEGLLADSIVRETLQKDSLMAKYADRPIGNLRASIFKARKFVLDDTMSSFLADLSTVPLTSVAQVRWPEVMDRLRYGARLPNPVTWIEYDQRAFRKRMLEISPDAKDPRGAPLAVDDQPPRMGWLLEEHPQVETAVKMTVFVDSDMEGIPPFVLPFMFAWQCTNNPLPWTADHYAGILGHGVIGYASKQMGVMYSKPLTDHAVPVIVQNRGEEDQKFQVHALLPEFAGGLRYAMALLSTINDIPTSSADIRPAKGYMARGNYRRFMEHQVIRLNVPQKVSIARLAKKVIAAARRRAHEVRGHWRHYQRGAGVLCNPGTHNWGPTDNTGHAPCALCSAYRKWIDRHDRGDASLGYVTHEYSISHKGRKDASSTK